jgi:Immunity protein Imm1
MWANYLAVDGIAQPLSGASDIRSALDRLDGSNVQEVSLGLENRADKTNIGMVVSTDGEGRYCVTQFNNGEPKYLINPQGTAGLEREFNIGHQTTPIDDRQCVSFKDVVESVLLFAETGELHPRLQWNSEI